MEAKWRVRGLGMQIHDGNIWRKYIAYRVISILPKSFAQWQASFKSLNKPTFGRCLPDEPHIPYSAKGE